MNITEEQLEQITEALSSAHYNCGNIAKVGLGIVPMVQRQIETAIKVLDPEWEAID